MFIVQGKVLYLVNRGNTLCDSADKNRAQYQKKKWLKKLNLSNVNIKNSSLSLMLRKYYSDYDSLHSK